MSSSELVTIQHLARKAIVYVRQSSQQQIFGNNESLQLQYALCQRARELGWCEDKITTIDCDLGTTAASAEHREGFKQLLAEVTLGEVGIILSYDVTRLSRNCSDWYPLLDLCGYKGCLIADRDSIYDPGSANGRLLLGLKGQISEMELHTLRGRLTAGLLNKAERGELALTLPVGLVRDELGIVHKDPNSEVCDRITLIFQTFLRVKSACKVVRELNAANLLIPRRGRWGDIVWRKPSTAAIISLLKNPAYAGAFVYGRTRTTRTGPAPHQAHLKRLPIEEWKIRVNDRYPAYISWSTYEEIQAQLQDNYAEYDRNKTRGIPRPGAALLHGLVYCGECGHKMVVQYKGSPRYICNYLRQQYQVSVCQYIPAAPVDRYVVQAFFEALSVVELDAYTRAVKSVQQTDETLERARQQQLERLRYQAALAERQFERVDPDNRLVAAELERRWEKTLRELQQFESSSASSHPPPSPTLLSPELKSAFMTIGQQLPQIWDDDALTRVQKKALLRCLIDKVVLHRLRRDCIRIRIIWKGGDDTLCDLPIPVGSLAELTRGEELKTRIVTLARQGCSDDAIAEQLTAEGFRSPLALTLLPSTVKRIRLEYGIFQQRHQSHPRQIDGYLTISQLAQMLNFPKHWFYDRIHNGTIAIARDETTHLYLFPDEPQTLTRLQQLRTGRLQHLRFS